MAQISCSRVPVPRQSSSASAALARPSASRPRRACSHASPARPKASSVCCPLSLARSMASCVGRLGHRPAIGGCLVAGDQVECERQHADRGAGPRRLQRVAQQRAPGTGLAEEQRRDGQPGQQAEIVAHLGRVLGQRDRLVAPPRSRQQHLPPKIRAMPEGHRGQETSSFRRASGQPGSRFLGHRQHLGRVPGVEARAGRFGQHGHGGFRVGPSRRCGQDRVAAHHRTAQCRDVPGQPVHLDQRARIAGQRASLVKQATAWSVRPASHPASAACHSSHPRRSSSAVSRPARSKAAAAVA